MIDTGDLVLHVPSGETWLVAFCEGGKLCACGWPETIADEADCKLVRKASEEQRMSVLSAMSHSQGIRGDYARRVMEGK